MIARGWANRSIPIFPTSDSTTEAIMRRFAIAGTCGACLLFLLIVLAASPR